MKTKYIFWLLISLLVSNISYGQRKHLEEGDEYYRQKLYREAIASYKLALEESVVVKKFYMTQQVAKTYKRLFDYKNAAEWYARLMEFKEENTAENIYEYAEILMSLEQYSKAAEIFKAYCDKAGKTQLYSKYEQMCKWPDNNKNKVAKYNTFKTNIETGGRSMGVCLYQSGLIFASPQSQDFSTKTIFYDLVSASSRDSITFGAPVVLSGKTNRSYYEGTPSVSADGKWLFFTSNASETEKYKPKQANKEGLSKSGMNVLKVYRAELVGTSWENVQELTFNSNEYSCAFPFISPDGNTIYFASDMPGGFGGFDIYSSTKNADNTWGTPKNLGSAVNTDRDEIYPFVQGEKLYFSSRGLPGYGGLDIFSATYKNGTASNIENAGKPWNSPKDDFSFVITPGGKDGYFSSNREGDNGYDYIYYFKKKYVPDTIRGVVLDKITNKTVKDVKVELFLVADDGTETSVNHMLTKQDGKWEFLIDPEKKYKVVYTLENYETEKRTVSSVNEVGDLKRNEEKSKLSPVYMSPIVKKDNVVRIDNIYFDFDKASIKPESFGILDNIVAFLKENPAARIELSAHTDAVGKDAYNLNLSKKRAQSCFDYLVSKGIDKSRLVPVGYGEKKLLNNCKKQIDCPDEQHAVNRRVEVKFL
ncbi:MAG: OmpA family protein [Bacteroidota bacterium]